MSPTRLIAVGYDGSPDAEAALTWAATMASLRHEQLVVIIVVDPHENPRGVAWPESWWEEIEECARLILDRMPGVEYRLQRRTGNRVETPSEMGHDASMIVVGSNGHSVVGQVFVGSVSQSLARHAVPPVVVVRQPWTHDAGHIVVGYDGQATSRRALGSPARSLRARVTRSGWSGPGSPS